jgi:cell division protein FtsB
MLRFSQKVDAEFAYLEARVEALETENTKLRRENRELLGKYIAAQDLAYNRMIQNILNTPAAALVAPAGAREPE